MIPRTRLKRKFQRSSICINCCGAIRDVAVVTGQYKDSGGSRPVRPVKAMTTGMDQSGLRQTAEARYSTDSVKMGRNKIKSCGLSNGRVRAQRRTGGWKQSGECQ